MRVYRRAWRTLAIKLHSTRSKGSASVSAGDLHVRQGMNAMKNDQHIHVLQDHNIVSHVDGYWLRHYATDFLAAAQAFEAPENRFSPVKYYLVCHSIELSLKSFLFSAGFIKKHRQQLGRDGEKALIAAEENGFGSLFVFSLFVCVVFLFAFLLF